MARRCSRAAISAPKEERILLAGRAVSVPSLRLYAIPPPMHSVSSFTLPSVAARVPSQSCQWSANCEWLW
eukprot:809565-Rhodomonas_salina.1